MSNLKIRTCPTCNGSFEQGFALKNTWLHFIKPEDFHRFVLVGEDLNRRSLLTRLLPARTRFSPSYLCRSCELYLVDLGTTLSRKQAIDAARRGHAA